MSITHKSQPQTRQKSHRDTNVIAYRSLTAVQRQERLLELQDLIDAPLQTGERKAQLWREKGRLLVAGRMMRKEENHPNQFGAKN